MNEEINILIKQNERLIYSLMKDYNNYIDKEDLYQVGVIGLINAYKNFKEDKGVKFSSYAYLYIQGEIKKYLRENRTFKINKDTSALCNKVKHANSLLEQRLMRKPTTKELCEFLEIDELKLETILGIQNPVQSLDEPIINNGKSSSLYEIIPNKENNELDDLISLKENLNKLSLNDKTQSEVAKILGLSQVKVSREEKKILQKLKASMVA